MAAQDLKHTDEQDIAIENGDFKIIESDQDHILVILRSYLGAFKQYPLVGLGIDYYLASSTEQNIIKRNMSVQLVNDGYQVKKITVKNGDQYFVDAERVKNT